MFNRCFLLFFVVTFVVSCGPEPKFNKEDLAEQEQAWAQMMEGHDVVMPLMNDLYQVSTQLKELAADAMVEASDFHPRAQEALANIEKAEDGMMEWMGGIKENPKDSVRARYEDHAAIMAFIDKEKTDIDQVAEDMRASISAAKALIQERTGNQPPLFHTSVAQGFKHGATEVWRTIYLYRLHQTTSSAAMKITTLFSIIVTSLVLVACNSSGKGELKYYGFHDTDPNTGDTIYHQIRDFSFVDQDSQEVTNAYFDDKIYIADFFFTSCPTICPKVKAQMLRIYEKYQDDDRVALLSHTIDVKRDTVGKLKKYATGLGADSPQWRFVTGDRDSIYAISYDYISTVLEAPEVPGGFDHSGWILLIDKDRHLRAYADGTKEEKVDVFLKQIDQLLEEYDKPEVAQ